MFLHRDAEADADHEHHCGRAQAALSEVRRLGRARPTARRVFRFHSSFGVHFTAHKRFTAPPGCRLFSARLDWSPAALHSVQRGRCSLLATLQGSLAEICSRHAHLQRLHRPARSPHDIIMDAPQPRRLPLQERLDAVENECRLLASLKTQDQIVRTSARRSEFEVEACSRRWRRSRRASRRKLTRQSMRDQPRGARAAQGGAARGARGGGRAARAARGARDPPRGRAQGGRAAAQQQVAGGRGLGAAGRPRGSSPPTSAPSARARRRRRRSSSSKVRLGAARRRLMRMKESDRLARDLLELSTRLRLALSRTQSQNPLAVAHHE